jgi:hypothetical protein
MSSWPSTSACSRSCASQAASGSRR